MYVNPFIAGIFACLVAEIILILLLGIIRGIFGVSNHNDHETEIRQIVLFVTLWLPVKAGKHPRGTGRKRGLPRSGCWEGTSVLSGSSQ